MDTTAAINHTHVTDVNDINDVNDTLNDKLFDISYRAEIYLLRPAPILMLLLAFIGIFCNAFSIAALCQIPNRLNTHYRLILSLAVSDTLIGVSIVLYLLNRVINPSIKPGSGSDWVRIKSRCAFIVIKALNTTALNISLLNLMGMSVDHYTAITKPLRYQKLLSKRRARILIVCLWTIAVVCGFSDFFSPLVTFLNDAETDYNFCELVWMSSYHDEYLTLALAPLCLVVMLCLYIRIYYKVHHHKMPGEVVLHGVNRKDTKRNRRALVTTLLILGSFIVCWLPTCAFQITMLILVRNGFIEITDRLRYILTNADNFLLNSLLVNCIFDAVIYTLRCKEVRIGYRKLLTCACACGKMKPGSALGCRTIKASLTTSSRSTECTGATSRSGKTSSTTKTITSIHDEHLQAGVAKHDPDNEEEDVFLDHNDVTLDHNDVTLDHKNVLRNHKCVSFDHEDVFLNHKDVSLDHKDVFLNHKDVSLDHKSVFFDHK